jgi:CRISP-associated protein Cas1
MIKKTLYFGSPAYLFCKNEQLVAEFKEEQTELNFYSVDEDNEDEKWKERYANRINPTPSPSGDSPLVRGRCSFPIEDIGVIVIDHWGISISHYLIASLLENNTAIITCSKAHMPTGLLLNLDSNSLQGEKFKYQIEASEPLKKQLWQQTVQQKIKNQAVLLSSKTNPLPYPPRSGPETSGGVLWMLHNMLKWSKEVKSGDSENHEARAAAFYWKAIFSDNIDFYRSRTGPPPNSLLNYGYAILRAITARALAGSGLLPTLGIHHHNKYNAYQLADDVMEPFRPFVDKIVCEITNYGTETEELTPKIKKRLLEISSMDVYFPFVPTSHRREGVKRVGKKPINGGNAKNHRIAYKMFSGCIKKNIISGI